MLPEFVRFPTDSLHPVLDLAMVERRFAGRDWRQWPFLHSCIDAPLDLWVNNTVRRTWRIAESPDDGPRLPTDVFLWWPGKARDRRATRMGGVPFLPRDAAWPHHEGREMTFVAQFAFHDSRDLVGKLPGDVLLVFAAEESSLLHGEGLYTQWVADSEIPIEAAECPPPAWPFFRGFGVRCRTWDAPRAYDRSYEAHEELERTDKPRAASEKVWCSPVIQATKIGGAPWDAQTIRPVIPARHRFLCQLSAMHFSPEDWGLGPEHLEHYDRTQPEHSLSIGDVGSTAFHIGPRGRLRWEGSCG